MIAFKCYSCLFHTDAVDMSKYPIENLKNNNKKANLALQIEENVSHEEGKILKSLYCSGEIIIKAKS